MDRPIVKLLGADGNAFNVIGLCHRAAKKAKWPQEHWKKVQDEMLSGDYNHLLRVAMEHFNVE